MPRDHDLIAIDFDGTLLDPDGRVSPATKAAVRRCVDAGYEVVFATGRNRWESLGILESVEHHATAVFVAGALTVDLETERTIDRRPMGAAAARATVALFDSLDLASLVLQDRDLAGVDFLHGPRPLPERVREWHRRNELIVRQVDDLAEIDHAHTLRVSTLGPPAAVEAAEQNLAADHADSVFAYRVDLANFGVRLLEAFAAGVNKWAAVERHCGRVGIDPRRTIAIGDDLNDLHLVRHAGLGVAMGNARDPVKAVADRVIGTNAEDGLAAFLNEL